jgi:hypothetical protein
VRILTTKQFWNNGFIFCCFAPLALLTILQFAADNYLGATWQAITLLLLCVNNYLLCSNNNLKKELLEQLQVNLALIQHLKEILNEESKKIK